MSSSYRPEFARSEVPQLLIQAVFAYLQNPGLEKYTGFVVSLDRTVVHVAKGVMTEKYLKSLCSGQALNGDLEFYRSEAFDLLERDGRREFLRVLVGMLKYLAEEND